MKKAIRDNRVCFVAESLDEAKSIITALSCIVPFYTQYNGSIYKIDNIRNVSITLIAEADIEEVEEGVKE
jgi:hypothetical protein